MKKFIPHEYQRYAAEYIITHPVTALLLDMGLGKTVTTLTAVNELMYDYFEISKLTEFMPDYKRYGRGAPMKRNLEIIAYADFVLAFWDGKSRGTKYVIDNCKKQGVPIKVYLFKPEK